MKEHPLPKWAKFDEHGNILIDSAAVLRELSMANTPKNQAWLAERLLGLKTYD